MNMTQDKTEMEPFDSKRDCCLCYGFGIVDTIEDGGVGGQSKCPMCKGKNTRGSS